MCLCFVLILIICILIRLCGRPPTITRGLQESLDGYEGPRVMIVRQSGYSDTHTRKPGAVPGKHPEQTGEVESNVGTSEKARVHIPAVHKRQAGLEYVQDTERED